MVGWVYTNSQVNYNQLVRDHYSPYPLVSSHMGWKVPKVNEGFMRKITDQQSIFQQTMFDDTGGYLKKCQTLSSKIADGEDPRTSLKRRFETAAQASKNTT